MLRVIIFCLSLLLTIGEACCAQTHSAKVNFFIGASLMPGLNTTVVSNVRTGASFIQGNMYDDDEYHMLSIVDKSVFLGIMHKKTELNLNFGQYNSKQRISAYHGGSLHYKYRNWTMNINASHTFAAKGRNMFLFRSGIVGMFDSYSYDTMLISTVPTTSKLEVLWESNYRSEAGINFLLLGGIVFKRQISKHSLFEICPTVSMGVRNQSTIAGIFSRTDLEPPYGKLILGNAISLNKGDRMNVQCTYIYKLY
jgi:hypothetical protein